MAMQHSGSVTVLRSSRHLRMTSSMAPGWRRRPAEGGRPAYLLVDALGGREFRRRFSGHSEFGSLDCWPPLAEIAAGVRVRLYELPGRLPARSRCRSSRRPRRRLLPAGSGWLAPAADPVR
ncbi:MAG: hypothetical protein R2712_04355 [Vicinamibacterales bacterium]